MGRVSDDHLDETSTPYPPRLPSPPNGFGSEATDRLGPNLGPDCLRFSSTKKRNDGLEKRINHHWSRVFLIHVVLSQS